MAEDASNAVVELRTVSPEHTRAIGAALAELLRTGDLLVLSGDLGAGKTCLTQGIGVGLDITDRITSPTFTIAAEYAGRLLLHHLDVYRLDDPAETLDLDLPELLESGVTVIEWGEEIDAVLPAERLSIRLRFGELSESDTDPRSHTVADDVRLLELVGTGEGWRSRSAALAALADVDPPGDGSC